MLRYWDAGHALCPPLELNIMLSLDENDETDVWVRVMPL